jgi:hypothetical protein
VAALAGWVEVGDLMARLAVQRALFHEAPETQPKAVANASGLTPREGRNAGGASASNRIVGERRLSQYFEFQA